jgi:hypothetical protein
VDDVGCKYMTYFQDGVIAQAANDVARLTNVPHVFLAGNEGKASWEGLFTSSGRVIDGCELHDFGDEQTSQRIVRVGRDEPA